MKSKRIKKALVAVVIVLLLAPIVYAIGFVIYDFRFYYAGIPLGGDYEKISTRFFTTQDIPLELAYQFEFGEELPNAYPNAFYDAMPVETLNERFGIDFASEDEWVAISRSREIGALVYDINWRLANYEKSWGSIAIPLYKMRSYSPNTIYVYTSRFPVSELYTGEFHDYFSADIRYDESAWDYFRWHESYPSQKRNFWREFKAYLCLYIPYTG
jgi:hypothetical protein